MMLIYINMYLKVDSIPGSFTLSSIAHVAFSNSRLAAANMESDGFIGKENRELHAMKHCVKGRND
jgi:hypothetical protein